jgi:hypothetical protein
LHHCTSTIADREYILCDISQTICTAHLNIYIYNFLRNFNIMQYSSRIEWSMVWLQHVVSRIKVDAVVDHSQLLISWSLMSWPLIPYVVHRKAQASILLANRLTVILGYYNHMVEQHADAQRLQLFSISIGCNYTVITMRMVWIELNSIEVISSHQPRPLMGTHVIW